MITCNFIPETQIIISMTNNGTAPIAMATVPGSAYELQTTPATPAAGQIGVATNVANTGLTITSDLASDRDFQVTYISPSLFTTP